MSGVVIIGGGHAGAQTAASLRQDGYDGRISLISDEPTLPYHRPPLSKSFLKNPAETQQLLFAEKFYADKKIELVLNTRVSGIDIEANRVTFSNSAALKYTHLVLAAGARGRQLPVRGADLRNIFGLRTAADADSLRAALGGTKNIVVIGGGFIGLEAAATFASLGHGVTVLEVAPRLLGRAVSPAVSTYVEDQQKRLGIRVVTQAAIEEFIGADGTVRGLVTTSGEMLDADLVLVGIGAIPNCELAKDAGLTCDNGIVVDGGLRSMAHGIFAIGDCASYPHWHAGRPVRLESVQNAVDHAKHVSKAIQGRPGDYSQVPWFWSDLGGTRLQMAGIGFDADRYVVSGDTDGDNFSVYHFRQGRLLAVDSVNRTLDHMIARKLISAGISPRQDDIEAGPERLKLLAGAVPV